MFKGLLLRYFDFFKTINQVI